MKIGEDLMGWRKMEGGRWRRGPLAREEREGKATYEEISLWEWASEEAGVLDCLLESWGECSWHFECRVCFSSLASSNLKTWISSKMHIRFVGDL